ncbi:MAG: hypothetical protein JWN34_1021 [Bryobacterales bacterium]|nr:hypothetical protein [Bryobacterales bacterium]
MFPLAAAVQLKRGAALYREVWFDKPPLLPWFYVIWGVGAGPLLRVVGALYDLVACVLAFQIAFTLWARREALIAAGLMAFFLIFDTHSAVLPLGADLLLLVPHLAAILLALRRQPLLAGVAAGIGFLINVKSLFVLAACAVFVWPAGLSLLLGFAIPCAIAAGALGITGSFQDWYQQAWLWPSLYASSPVVVDPIRNGLLRSANWLGFHAALVIGAAVYYRQNRNRRLALWMLFTFTGVVLGWRFFPRYFFLFLPALLIPAARGLSIARRWVAVLAIGVLTIPAVRFGPRYLNVTNSPDLALDRDSREASRIALTLASSGSDSLFVWGYRPEIFVYTGFRPATRYLDSQALTGVPADRHLTQSTVVLTAGTQAAREELARARPDIVIDGLTLFNPGLSMNHYAELRPWLAHYRETARTHGTIIYKRIPDSKQ